MRCERRIAESFAGIAPRDEKIAAMQARVDEARDSPDDTRTGGDLEAEAEAQAALTWPMRIQDALRDAEPQR